jgi:transcriptional regulator with XRE-family HTH domain
MGAGCCHGGDAIRRRIGAAIRDERLRQGMSQVELADRMGIPTISDAQISRWETGRVLPKARHLAALEVALGVCFQLVRGDGEDVGA